MRIPYPERISPWKATVFAFTLLMLQLLTRTDLFFSLLCFFFVLVSVAAFNIAGGLTRPSGAYVFFFSILSVILGIVCKVLFLEPGQTHLVVPIATMETYLAGIVGMLIAVYLSRRFSPRKGFLQNIVSDENLRGASVGCIIVGIAVAVITGLLTSGGTETLLSPVARAISQLNRFPELAIILGVTYEIRSSGGRRSLNIPVLIAWAYIFFAAVLLGYSKQGLFTPFVCWLVVAAVLGYRFRLTQLIITGFLLLFCFVYMVPYCQYGRIFRSETNTFRQNLSVSFDLITNLREVRRLNQIDDLNVDSQVGLRYFDNPHGLIDRLQMLTIDDTLHVVTDQSGPSGVKNIVAYVANAIPRVIWKNKPDIKNANIYGHELGLLAPEDETTSISVSPIGEAYRVAQWGGILVLAPAIWFVLFLVMDSVCGDPRESPWAILVIVTFAHIANEGALAAPIYMLTFGLLGILFVAFVTVYILPIVASVVVPPRRKEFVIRAAGASLSR